MLTDIPIDFSALSTLSCARKYQLTCIKGVDTSGENTNFGSAFHQYAEARNKGDKRQPMDIIVPLAIQWKCTPAELVTCCMSFDTVFPKPLTQRDTQGAPLVEYKFSIPICVVNNKWRIVLCGTIDLVELAKDYILLTDYKTTLAVRGADKLVRKYTSSFQLVFYQYIIHKYLHQFLPPPHDEYARNLRMGARYVMVYRSLSPPKLEATPPRSITPHEIAAIEALLERAITEVVALHESTEALQPPEGTLYGTCVDCFFANYCASSTPETTLELINRLPTRNYDPTNFR